METVLETHLENSLNSSRITRVRILDPIRLKHGGETSAT